MVAEVAVSSNDERYQCFALYPLERYNYLSVFIFLLLVFARTVTDKDSFPKSLNSFKILQEYLIYVDQNLMIVALLSETP